MESDEQAFLNAMADAPEDDAPRLIFADWLEERDDPRAAWVRDRELFAWMGPQASDPTAAMTRTWEERWASLEYIARDQIEATEQQVRDLGRLIGRLGESIADYAWEQFTAHPMRWPYVEGMLVEVAPWLAPRAADVARLAKGVVSIHRWLAFQILIAGGQRSPAMLQHMFDLANDSAKLLRQSAYNTLAETPAPYRAAIIEFAVELLQRAVAEDQLQDSDWLRQLVALIGPDVAQSPTVLATMTNLLTCRSPALVEAASEALEAVRDQVTPILGQAIRDSKPATVAALINFVPRVVPDPVGYLMGLCLAPKARLDVIEASLNQLAQSSPADVPRIEPLFRRMLTHPQYKVRQLAIQALQNHSRAYADDCLRWFDESWEQQRDEEKFSIIYAVRDLTSLNRSGMPLMYRALNDPHHQPRTTAASVLNFAGHGDRVVERLTARLRDRDEDIRAAAVIGLFEFVPYRGEMVDGLEPMVGDSSPRVRWAFWEGLKELNGIIQATPKTRGAFCKLARQGIRDSNARVCQVAILATVSLGISKDLLPDIVELGRDESPRVRAAVANVVAEHVDDDRPRRLIQRAFRDEDIVIENTLHGLNRSYCPESFAADIIALANHRSAPIRVLAQRLLQHSAFDPPSAEVQQAVRRGLTDINEAVVKEALQTLAQHPDQGAFAMTEALQVLDWDWPNLDCTEPLTSLFRAMPPATTELVKRVTHSRENVRRVAYSALASLLPTETALRAEAMPALAPALLQQLPKELGPNLASAIDLVGTLGPSAVACLPFLQQAIERPYFECRAEALKAIGKLGPTAAVVKETLLRTFRSEPHGDGHCALLGLVHLAGHQPDLWPFLDEQLQQSDPSVLINILREMSEVPALGHPLGGALVAIVEQHPHDLVREFARNTLAKMAPAMEPHRERIGRLLETGDETMQVGLLRMLADWNEVATPLGPILERLATEGSSAVRQRVAKTLETVPVPARALLLGTMLHDRERDVRIGAGMALFNIRSEALPALADLGKALANPQWDGNLDEHGQVINHEVEGAIFSGLGQDIRTFLAMTVQEFGSAARPILPDLARMINERNQFLMINVCTILNNCGEEALPILKQFAKRGHESFRHTAKGEMDRLLGEA